MEQHNISEREKMFIHRLFPPPKESWEKLINVFIFKVNKENGYYFLASVCARDIAECFQSCYKSFFYGIKDYLIERKYKINGDDYERAAIFKLRYYLDYAIITLVSLHNHLSSGYWHLYFKENFPLEHKYKSPKDIFKEINRIDSSDSFYKYIHLLCKNKDFTALTEYRNIWIHRGIPVIEGEYRFKRNKLWELENFFEGNIGLYNQDKAIYMVEYTEKSDYTVKKLIRMSSSIFKLTNNFIDIFVKEMEKEKNKII